MTDTQFFTEIRTAGDPGRRPGPTKTLFERLGFSTQLDTELQPGFRWIELAPPGAATSIALVTSGPQLPAGIDTGLRLVAPDARRAHRELQDLGLEVGDLLDWESVPLMFSFTDYDGNRLYVAEPEMHDRD